MATIALSSKELEALGGVQALNQAIEVFQAALEKHKFTEGVPAPTSSAEVENIVRNYGGTYKILPAVEEENT